MHPISASQPPVRRATICKIVIPANQAVADLYNMDNNCRLFISVFVFTKIINCDLGVIL